MNIFKSEKPFENGQRSYVIDGYKLFFLGIVILWHSGLLPEVVHNGYIAVEFFSLYQVIIYTLQLKINLLNSSLVKECIDYILII